MSTNPSSLSYFARFGKEDSAKTPKAESSTFVTVESRPILRFPATHQCNHVAVESTLFALVALVFVADDNVEDAGDESSEDVAGTSSLRT